MTNGNTCEQLRSKLREREKTLKRAGEDNPRRLQRAIGWFCHSQKDNRTPQEKFIFLWIAFNALYGIGGTTFGSGSKSMRDFLRKILKVDGGEKLSRNLHWHPFRRDIRNLFSLRQAYKEFWDAIYAPKIGDAWKGGFEAEIVDLKKALLSDGKFTGRLLCLLFNRLYVVRNQLLHGAMSENTLWGSRQVSCGVTLLETLVPQMIDIILDGREDWGKIPYPQVGDKPNDECDPPARFK